MHVDESRIEGTATVNLFQQSLQKTSTRTMPDPRRSNNALGIVNVVELNDDGRPTNMHRYNVTTSVLLYTEEQANVDYIACQVCEK